MVEIEVFVDKMEGRIGKKTTLKDFIQLTNAPGSFRRGFDICILIKTNMQMAH